MRHRDRQCASRPQHAPELAQRGGVVADVFERLGAEDLVEDAVGERKGLELRPRQQRRGITTTSHGDGVAPWIDAHRRHPAQPAQQAELEAGAARDVEHALAVRQVEPPEQDRHAAAIRHVALVAQLRGQRLAIPGGSWASAGAVRTGSGERAACGARLPRSSRSAS